MSIIGTRPPLISETNFYELHHRARLAIKPGITGMWQVSGRSDITDFEEVVRLDKEYITDWNIGLDIKILFKTVMVVLYPYYETGIQEINGKNFLYSRPLVPEAKTKYPSRIKGRFKIADEEVAGKYSLEEMARRAYISQKSVELEPVEVIKMLGEEIDPYQDGFLEEVKNTNFRLVPEKLPEAISCTLKVDGSDLEYDMMMKIQPVDPDKHILCMANENDSDGLKIIIVYSLVDRKISFTYRLNFNTWSDVRKFTLFQMTALKGSVIKIETKEEKEELFKATLQEPLSSESIEELKGDLELIKNVILVETEFGVSFSISDGFDNDDQEMLYFLANSIRRIPQEMQWTSYNAEARLTPATEADTKDLFNIYRLDHAVTANQKVILKAFGLDANSIKYFASELSKELKEAE